MENNEIQKSFKFNTIQGTGSNKDEILKLSEEWTEFQESMFRKLLQQGGKSVINKIPFEVRIPEF